MYITAGHSRVTSPHAPWQTTPKILYLFVLLLQHLFEISEGRRLADFFLQFLNQTTISSLTICMMHTYRTSIRVALRDDTGDSIWVSGVGERKRWRHTFSAMSSISRTLSSSCLVLPNSPSIFIDVCWPDVWVWQHVGRNMTSPSRYTCTFPWIQQSAITRVLW